ncbi:MAG: helix-turn-helix domain-containing protein [Chloroflexota bacterium]|nr:helix-turn-helix domain-containing protein [Chloroflexota bacterium]
MPTPGFKFIDLPTAAERLGITRTELLNWVDEGRIRPFSGKGQQSVFRTADVERLVAEVGAAAAQVAAEAEQPAHEGEAPTRTRRRDPVKLIGTRLSQTSRWAEITDLDISTWIDALDPVQYDRVRKVVDIAMDRLQKVRASVEQKR